MREANAAWLNEMDAVAAEHRSTPRGPPQLHRSWYNRGSPASLAVPFLFKRLFNLFV